MDSYYLRGDIFFNLRRGKKPTKPLSNISEAVNTNKSINSNNVYVKRRVLESNITLVFLDVGDMKRDDVMTMDELRRRYNIDGDITITTITEHNYRISKVTSTHSTNCKTMKAMKTFFFDPKNAKEKEKADDLLVKWIVMKRIGVLQECEIFEGIQSVHCIQKLWQTDLEQWQLQNINSVQPVNSMDLVKALMKDIIPTLKIMHDTDLVHGDIKPANLVMSNNSFGVIDFGCVARHYSRFPASFGTVPYRAPEMDRTRYEHIIITTEYDIFSLAISLIEIVVGYHPYSDCLPSDTELHELHGFIDEDLCYDLIQLIYDMMSENQGVDILFVDLLTNMLTVSVEERFDINDVINHGWFQTYCL